MNKVLALTYAEDPHADAVLAYLQSQGVDTFRINTERIIQDYLLSFDGEFTISDANRRERISKDWSIWNRRVMEPDLPPHTPKELETIVRTETERTWKGLLFSHQGIVVNKPQAEYAANNKIDQLLFAKSENIQTPNTLVTNEPPAAVQFFTEHSPICHKLQKVAVVERGGEQLVSYTNIVTNQHMEHIDAVRNHPTLFQEYVDKDYELRITVTRNEVIPIAIHSQDSEMSKIDFRRYDFDTVKYTKTQLPGQIESFCHNIRDHYGLAFAEIDMIRTKQGEYVFLELNPNGQWLWLELQSAVPLTPFVAKNLLP